MRAADRGGSEEKARDEDTPASRRFAAGARCSFFCTARPLPPRAAPRLHAPPPRSSLSSAFYSAPLSASSSSSPSSTSCQRSRGARGPRAGGPRRMPLRVSSARPRERAPSHGDIGTGSSLGGPGHLGALTRMGPPRARARLLLALGVTQMVLGGLIVAVSFAALALTTSARVRHSCPFWAGFSVLLSGLIGVLSWKRPISLVITFFTLLSAVCVMLNLAGSILSCQNAQLVTSLEYCHLINLEDDVCVCCENPKLNGCSNLGDTLKLNPLQACDSVRLALKDLLFSVCALNIISVAVCALATATRCMQMISSDVIHIFVPHRADQNSDDCPNARDSIFQGEDFDDFIPPVPPPPYYPPAYGHTALPESLRVGRLALTHYSIGHVYGARLGSPDPCFAGDLPPPYEAVLLSPPCSPAGARSSAVATPSRGSSSSLAPAPPGDASGTPRTPRTPRSPRGPAHRTSRGDDDGDDAAGGSGDTTPSTDDTKSGEPSSAYSTARTGTAPSSPGSPDERSLPLDEPPSARAGRAVPRPRSLVDFKAYRDTKLLVARFLEHSDAADNLSPEVQHVVDNIRSVIALDEGNMEEAIASANVIDQAIAGCQSDRPQPRQPSRQARRQSLNLSSCGETSSSAPSAQRRLPHHGEHDRPHSHIGICRETVL
ncbi:unnamed protein product [Lampetra fluviatilis]